MLSRRAAIPAIIALGLAGESGVDSRRATPASSRHERAGGDLHILAVGVNSSGLDIPLRTPEADAKAIAEAFRRNAGVLFNRVFTTTLLGEQATRSVVTRTFADLALRVTPDDTFILFYAGHGWRLKDRTGQAEVMAFGLADSRPGNGIPGVEMRSLIRRIQARRTLLLLDACYGALSFGLENPSAALQGGKDVARATDSSLMLLGATDMAFELSDSRYSVMTAAILKALSKEDPRAQQNGRVTARTLARYVKTSVEELIKGAPIAYSISGTDFPVFAQWPGAVVGPPGPSNTSVLPSIKVDEPVFHVGQTISTTGIVELHGYATNASSLEMNGTSISVGADGAFAFKLSVPIGNSVARLVAANDSGDATELHIPLVRSSRGPGDVAPTPEPLPTPPVSGPPTRRYEALLFASDNYSPGWETLKNPTFDARAIANVLRDLYGFAEPEVVANPRRDEIVTKLTKYQGRAYGSNDELLIFIASHGFRDESFDDAFLVASDSPKAMSVGNDGMFLEHMTLFRLVNKIPCKHILLILDSCFSGGFGPVVGATTAALSERTRRPAAKLASLARWSASAGATYGLDDDVYPERSENSRAEMILQRGKTRMLLTSGGNDYTSDGVPGHHSPFVAKLLDGLGNSKALLTASVLFDDYLTKVSGQAPNKVRFMPDAGGEFVFVLRGRQ